MFLYRKEAAVRETLERYGEGAPDDWLERNLYSRSAYLGIALMAAIDLVLFGLVPGSAIFLCQMAWIPFWAAGVINGVGHFGGYRNWPTEDASRNIVPWAILIGGEELHNNHHAYPTSAKLSIRWFELDIGWMYLRILEVLGLARIRRVAPAPRFVPPRPVADADNLQAIIVHRYDVLARYHRAMKRVGAGQREALRTTIAMRAELASLWSRSMASRDQLVRKLQDWCRRAEASGIQPLIEFSQRLRSYACQKHDHHRTLT